MRSINRAVLTQIVLTLALLIAAPAAWASDLAPEIEEILSGKIPEAVREFRDFDLLVREVRALYGSRNHQPVWVEDGRLSLKAIAVLGALEISGSHGLRPGDYLAGILSPGMELVGEEPIDSRSLARIDLGLSASTMRYIKDLHQGRFSPKQLHLGLDISHRELDLAVELGRVLEASDPTAVLDTFAPQGRGYVRLREELAYYRRLAVEEEWRALDASQPIRPGP